MTVADGRPRGTQARVGVFVLLALGVFIAIIYLLGARARLFEPKVTLYADFTEVGGLVEGATVRLAGVQIGRVTNVRLSGQPGGKVRVEMRIGSHFADRVRKNSVARIDTQGLLGDKIVEITVGSADAPAVRPGEVLAARDPADVAQILSQSAEVVRNVAGMSQSLTKTVETLNQSRIVEDVAVTAAAARRITEQVEKGRGLVHAMLYEEPAALRKLDRLLATTQSMLDRAERGEGAVGVLMSRDSAEAARRFVQAMDRFAQALDAKGGQGGLVSALLFDPKYRPVADDLRVVARNFREVSERVAGGRGMLGELTRDAPPDESFRQITADLKVAVANLRRVSERISAGEGTLGALIVDPTVYENLAAVLEGTQRSFLLRSLIKGLGEKGRESRPKERK